MVTRFALATLVAALLDCGSAYAQVGGMSISPGPALGFTSPLGVGPGSRVAPTRTPMGATELSAPAVSPLISGTSPMSPGTSVGTTCGASSAGASAGMGGSPMSGTSGSATAVFDGGGMTGSASGTCAASGGSLAGSAPMAASGTGIGSSSSVGPVGIPLGSTEMGGGGLSPPSVALTTNPLAPLTTLTPLVVMPPPSPSAPVSTSGSTAPCPTTATGVPVFAGPLNTADAFGAPLRGRALGSALGRCNGAP
jgi:hypothetical protein